MRIRPTNTEARVKKEMRRGERRAKVATRTAAHAAHRAGLKTVASHLRSLGVDETTAAGMAATLRKRISGGIDGFVRKDGIRRACTRYTLGQVMGGLVTYRPRKDTYKTARAHLLALAA
ncbi:hypothetical protein [Nocardiopsis tropica]|uniref:Uncharacterized protein n=1 Tax=Nocardiopsis tropica TaxID=109330 RepID=A0ABU7KQU9_9ACTN|nr:hypothetical protein [Nocardiopsis umidischolae]MEE2051680.1 hypothetical protein [Nocardiopsis umidischolae]